MENIVIVPFEKKYQQAFKGLNQWWIEAYFKMEEMDHKALDNPKSYILDRGGYIAIALLENKPAGVCALVKMENYKFDYELAKMGVSPTIHGKGIGYALGTAIIKKAKELGAKNIFLETHTSLQPAIHLYKKLGFKEIKGIESPYERSDYQMELNL
ncbi:ribosomal protein S18-alanine N-acetyltransferase [Croceitalea sp. MTPC9]|uniref:GNAT family N-acetyltransferase n=1 Tax=unclassified Croceitalea TaxID=2632280 RepID=UPI002B3D4643|nr:ribosomal protein S18-alanine N-acetyltransferase [Croceitalea sp. MTPC6]GMN15314.1 ribosomal protein S18-alanine N-acetyltransferase [Croceitalea sp. MTPC9]